MFTEKQIMSLKYLVFASKDGTCFTKRILAFLIDRSEGFTKEVCLTLTEDKEGYAAKDIRKTADHLGTMLSTNYSTTLTSYAV